MALGADLIEKHFTLSNQLPGPDHGFALEPEELLAMVQKIRQTEEALGSGIKQVQPIEKELRDFARRSVFAIEYIEAGEMFTRKNAAVLRKGKLEGGLEPKHYDELLGKRAQTHILKWGSIQAHDYR